MLKVHSFETLGGLDGPGIRFIVFLQGCNLRCKYCHNPDTWSLDNGQEFEAGDILKKAMRYKAYFGKNGGVTFSGGEPLLQAHELSKILPLFIENKINVTIDTSGSVFNEYVKECLNLCSHVILDLKHTDKREYNTLTGGSFETWYKVWEYLKEIKKETWLRQVIAPEITDNINQILEIKKYKSENITKIEFIPYHTLGAEKWNKLGLDYQLMGITPPSSQQMQFFNSLI